MVEYTEEIRALAAMREAKAVFSRNVVQFAEQYRAGHSTEKKDPLTAEEIRQLKSDGVEQIAELFFSIEELGLAKPDRLRDYLERHNKSLNDKLAAMRESGQAWTSSGLTRDRIGSGIIEPARIDALIDEVDGGVLRLDQSSLACLLVDVMAAESCRKLAILLAKCGFLRRVGTNNVRLRSLGILEGFYRDHLRLIVSRIKDVQMGDVP